ncbi:MAG TPA: prolyl oligopeptidase family serine peptidase [Rhizomicrobium sp.]|jgi:prolyl oligopeptidase
MKPTLALLAVTLLATGVALAATDPLAPKGDLAKPAAAPIKPVTETLYGQSVTDNYRYMEKLDPATISWMKAEGVYTRAVLDAIAPRAALGKRVAAFSGSFGFIQGYVNYGGRAFYEERAPGADNFDVVVKDAKGPRKIVDIAAVMAAHGGKPYAVNFFLPSPDGSKVAVGISEGGSEAASITVYDAATGKALAGPVDRAQFGATGWSDDSRTLFFNRLKQLAPNEPNTDKYKYSTADAWDLKSEPVVVSGPGVGSAPITPGVFPTIQLVPGAPDAILVSINGVQNELQAWLAPAPDAASPHAAWKPFIARTDDVTKFDMRGDTIFLLSHKNAPTFQVLALKAGAPISSAKVLVPAAPDRVIDDIHAASDGLYVLARKGAYSQLLRVPAGTTKIDEVGLPFEGHIAQAFSDPRQPGITIELTSWVVPPESFAYDPTTGKFTDLKLGVKGDIDPAKFVVSDLQAKARDGVMVPLSLIQPKGRPTPQIVAIEAYGSYGISELADFSPRRAVMMNEGITYGVCHVRGGGELGEAWRLGGKDANKHNTWDDLIACGQDLIARGITTKDKLFILGGSAGGITMGRAMTERPDLFAGVIDVVPAANPLRMEFSPNGPDNIPEFGTVTTKQGFEDLYADDSIQHVKKGVTYPAVMISTGLNDPRVAPWQPAKFTAALLASGTPNPVLLRIDPNAGHGIGSTRTQGDELSADWIAFILWRAGLPEWRPDLTKH